MSIEIDQILVPPAERVLIREIDWSAFERFLEASSEGRGTRVAYDTGVLELMTPSLEHEDDKEIIGDLIKALLEELDIEFRNAGSTTFRSAAMEKAIEPDQCFYIRNEARIRGKPDIDLTIDPPPDLALEIDITSRRSHRDIYEALGVPELWRFDGKGLRIDVLREGRYVATEQSNQFPDFPVREAIPQFLDQSRVDGRNAMMRAFRAWVRSVLVENQRRD